MWLLGSNQTCLECFPSTCVQRENGSNTRQKWTKGGTARSQNRVGTELVLFPSVLSAAVNPLLLFRNRKKKVCRLAKTFNSLFRASPCFLVFSLLLPPSHPPHSFLSRVSSWLHFCEATAATHEKKAPRGSAPEARLEPRMGQSSGQQGGLNGGHSSLRSCVSASVDVRRRDYSCCSCQQRASFRLSLLHSMTSAEPSHLQRQTHNERGESASTHTHAQRTHTARRAQNTSKGSRPPTGDEKLHGRAKL